MGNDFIGDLHSLAGAPSPGTLPVVSVYTDGACSPNPGFGGWGSVLISPAHSNARRELSGAEANTTNNRMELTGALMALKALKQPCEVTVHTDSRYLCDAFGKGWLKNWQKNGWRTSQRQPVLNSDLWQELLGQEKVHKLRWQWVPGHADNEENNRCDVLAVAARLELARTHGAAGS